MRSLTYILASLIVLAITASAGSYIKTERLEERFDGADKTHNVEASYIIKRLDRIERKLDLLIPQRR